MRAIFNQRIHCSKYEFSWKVDVVLDEILSWGSSSQLDIKLLSWKLVMLVALASACRSSAISYLNCKYMKQQGPNILFELPRGTKICCPCSETRKIVFDSFSKDENLCVVSCINEYLRKTQEWRDIDDKIDRSWLILSLVKPHHPMSTSSIARWLKETIRKAGITNFTAHSIRSASTSKDKRMGLSTKDIIDQLVVNMKY